MGGDTVLVGKPHAPVYEVAQAEVGKRGGSRVLAVGDGLPTDIRGAAMNGLPALFVTGGIHAADFGDHAAPDGERVAARLRAEDLDAVAYIPSLVWGSEAAS
jgi:ribonucleotide monophosphatase NagD (HAD superfamily)